MLHNLSFSVSETCSQNEMGKWNFQYLKMHASKKNTSSHQVRKFFTPFFQHKSQGIITFRGPNTKVPPIRAWRWRRKLKFIAICCVMRWMPHLNFGVRQNSVESNLQRAALRLSLFSTSTYSSLYVNACVRSSGYLFRGKVKVSVCLIFLPPFRMQSSRKFRSFSCEAASVAAAASTFHGMIINVAGVGKFCRRVLNDCFLLTAESQSHDEPGTNCSSAAKLAENTHLTVSMIFFEVRSHYYRGFFRYTNAS
jgi:hypothetical protein